MAFKGFMILVFIFGYFASAIETLVFLANLIGGSVDFTEDDLTAPTIWVLIFIFATILLVFQEAERRKTKGLECRAICLDGLPSFKREQITNLTLDVKNRILFFGDLKEEKVAIKLQQISQLNYIDWEGDVSRWKPGSPGFSYPGIFKGTRVYVPSTSGYAYTEKLRVNRALEIRYQGQDGIKGRIVLDISKDENYAEKLLESICRCTRLPAPQYIQPVKPAKPGPKYL